jgi:hypothetical protein
MDVPVPPEKLLMKAELPVAVHENDVGAAWEFNWMLTGSPEHTAVVAGKKLSSGIGCTVMVKIPGAPAQPSAVGMTV